MIPLELRLSGVRAFGNHVISLGGPEVREIVMFGPNGSGKSTIARMIQALMGDVPDELQQSFLDERDAKINRRAQAELTVLNPRGDEMWNPDWPERVVLGLEFGYENNRSFSRYYMETDGKQRQTYRTHEEYAAMFRRPPFNIKPDDRFMFIQQGESAALVQMRPRQRYETMKQFLGLEDLERQWQETLDAKERAMRELREAAATHADLEEGLRRKEISASRLRQYRELSEEFSAIQKSLAEDDLVIFSGRLDRAKKEEERLAQTLEGEKAKRDALREEEERSGVQAARLEEEVLSAEKALGEAKSTHGKASEARTESRKRVEELEGTVGSLERVASEGMSLEALEGEASAVEQALLDIEKQIATGDAERATLTRDLSGKQEEAARAQHAVQSLKEELGRASEVLVSTGPSEAVGDRLKDAQVRLEAAREAEYSAQEEKRRSERDLGLLEENHTALPADAVAARDSYVAQGTPAVILGDAVAPQDGLTLDERRAIEGALGELRWAVLVGDGRILVDYREYTIADFVGDSANTGPSGPSRSRDVRDGGASTSMSRDILDDGACALPPSCLSRLSRADGLPSCLSDILDAVLSSVIFADNHESAARRASRGFIAYTPDGYRYDRHGRKYSIPIGLCLGQAAYESAIEEARGACDRARAGEEQAAKARESAEKIVNELNEAFRSARGAESALERAHARLPETLAESDRLHEECGILASRIETLASSLTHMKVEQALRKREEEDLRQKIERVRRLEELPALRHELAACKERESAARRAADAALEDVRRLEEKIESARQGRSRLQFDLQRVKERLGDLVPRIEDLLHDLGERRRDVRELEASAGTVVDRWRQAFEKPEVSDGEALSLGKDLAARSAPASQSERAEWTRRTIEIRPIVDSLKDDVIPTAEEDYLSAKREFDKAESQLRTVEEAFRDASQKESAAQVNFKKVMQETFGRVSSRFERYLSRFGWTGNLRVEPVQGTQFELQIYLSVYEGTEPRPVNRNRSGGETSAVAALLTLAMVKEHRRPFYVFDEIDQSLDPANVIKLAAILREELDRKYIVISHRLNKTHLEQGQFGIGVYRSQGEGSRTRVYQRKDWTGVS